MRVAAVQLNSNGDKARNLAAAERLVRAAAADGAELVALPEKWNLLAGGEELLAGAEPLDGPSLAAARAWARELGIHLLAGSISERGGGEGLQHLGADRPRRRRTSPSTARSTRTLARSSWTRPDNPYAEPGDRRHPSWPRPSGSPSTTRRAACRAGCRGWRSCSRRCSARSRPSSRPSVGIAQRRMVTIVTPRARDRVPRARVTARMQAAADRGAHRPPDRRCRGTGASRARPRRRRQRPDRARRRPERRRIHEAKAFVATCARGRASTDPRSPVCAPLRDVAPNAGPARRRTEP